MSFQFDLVLLKHNLVLKNCLQVYKYIPTFKLLLYRNSTVSQLQKAVDLALILSEPA